jgi:PAS domain S-box-containing protein
MQRNKHRDLIIIGLEEKNEDKRPKHNNERRSKHPEKAIEDRIKDLRMNEGKLRSIFAASPDAITVTDLSANIIECNQATLDMHGYRSRKELIGKSAFELIAKKDHPEAIENMKKTMRQGSLKNVEYTFLTKDGHEFPAELSASVVFDASGKPTALVAITQDITERKKAEDALVESEKRYRSVVDNIGIGVAVISPNMEILALNSQMRKWFPDIDVSEKPTCYKAYNNPPRKKVCSYCPTCKTLKDAKVHESTTDTPRGKEIINYRIISSPLKDKDDKIMAAVEIVEDFTEHKRMERELKRYSQRLERLVGKRTANLRESEKRYRNLIETVPEAIFTISEKGIITSLNPTFEKTTGWRCSEWLGKPFEAIIHPDDLPLALETFQKTLLGKTPLPYELRVLSKSGKYLVGEFTSKPHVENGQIVGEFGIVRDITERKMTEKALKSSEAKFRSLFENVPAGVYQSSPEGKIITANPMLVHMLGYNSIAELLATDITRDLYVKPEDRKVWQRKLEESGELCNAELILRRKNGQKLTVLENAHVVSDEQGKVLYYEGTLTDITEKKMLEERLSALNYYSGKLNAAHSLQQIYELTLDVVEQILGFEYAIFLIMEKSSLKAACQRGYSKPLLKELPLDGSRKGITVKTANTRKPMLVPDVKKSTDYVEGVPRIRSELAVPIETEDNVIGVLDVQSRKVGAFEEKDMTSLQILASHAATAISNLKKRKEIEKRSAQMALLMKSSAQMIRSTDLHQRLRKIAESLRKHGWRRVVIRAFREANMETSDPKDMVTAGLTLEERKYLWNNRMPGQVWRERLGPEYERFRIGEFYYLPWSDSWVRKRFSQGTVSSHLKPEEMVDWDPEDLLYAPLRLADGRIVGMISIDDPIDGRRPTKESLASMELFLHQAAVAIENAHLFQQLNDAKNQIKEYADQLEIKVKQRTQELVEAQNKLLKAERLATIGEIAAMVGHDLRNPLTGITGATYYLKTKSGLTLDRRSREMLEIIERDVEYSNKIVNDLLDYSREIHLELKETSPKSIVKKAVSMVKVPRNIQILDLTRSKPIVNADTEKMKRAFVNLIKNAVDAMPKGGTLTIRSRKTGDQLTISFIDTGMGMSKDVLQKLWSPLFTTKAKGMGFGLPICKRVIEAHAGSISAESVAGKGTTFTITFPIKPELEGGGSIWVNVPESLLSTMMKA